MNIINKISIYIMAYIYINVGVKHFTDPNWFLHIIPPYLTSIGLELVYISGVFEIFLGTLLLFSKYRKIAGYGIILLLIAVYPANIYLAVTNGAALDITPMVAWGRLPVQFVFIGIAYLHSKL